ncbi:MAG: right-handed parallel beta-helix repeat-containing protein [Pseudonocardiaceae bacterium]
MTTAVTGPIATASVSQTDLTARNAGSGHLPDPALDDDDPAADQSRCHPDGQAVTPSAQPSTKLAPDEPVPAQTAPAQSAPAVLNSQLCGPDGTAGVLPVAISTCTINATRASQVNSAKPGDTVCFSGSGLAGSRLRITTSGTGEAPIIVTGDGATTVKGITVNARNVVVQGFNVIGAAAPGVQLKGDNLTLQNTRIDHPTGGDHDGIRYFGDRIKILHNQISNITNTGGAHADCMQTFATTTPTSHDVLISGNRCDKIDNQCLIAQGPHSRAGDGSGRGESSRLVFTNNFCDAHASQAVHIDDVQNVTMINNEIQGRVQKAFNLINGSTGSKVGCNKLGPGVGREVVIDRSSQGGSQGS